MVYNGMLTTVNSFMYYDNKSILIDWLKTLPHGYKIDNMIITHAGFSKDIITKKFYVDNWAKTPEFIKSNTNEDYTFIFGHWHAKALKEEILDQRDANHSTFIYKNYVGLDAATVISNFVNIYVVESDGDLIVLDKNFRFE
jgi:serine/threonine protein phosphatase 1